MAAFIPTSTLFGCQEEELYDFELIQFRLLNENSIDLHLRRIVSVEAYLLFCFYWSNRPKNVIFHTNEQESN
jgi:hypothetical protein